MVKEDKRAELGLAAADAFMDEYAFILAQADELTTVRLECSGAKKTVEQQARRLSCWYARKPCCKDKRVKLIRVVV